MEIFWTWFNDPLIQSVVISPLVGAILGVLFAGLNSTPAHGSPASVQQTIIVFKQTINVRQNRQQSNSSEDGWAYLMALFVVIAGITWGYSRYSDEILYCWLSGIFSCTAFILAAGAASAMRDQFNAAEWGWYIFTPIVAIAFSFYLLHLAKLGIVPGAREAAQNNGFIEFYTKVLKDEHRMWILLQIIGVLLGVVSTITATFRSLHYLALMNQRSSSSLASLWYFFARITMFSSRKSGIFLLAFSSVLSYMTLTGTAYNLWQNGG